MNIFILDNDINKCAENHVDKHVVKMPLESAQMLCTVHWIQKFIGYTPRKINSDELAILREAKKITPRPYPYLPAMPNHPCTIWVRESLDNYEWLYVLALALNDEYGYRYGGKSHKSIEQVVLKLPEIDLPRKGLTPFAQAMPDEYKNEDAVVAYREYYNNDKYNLFSWKGREVPKWANGTVTKT
tara:strand:+ start:1337 stop:1891 length:555 start_codon:yes stop_codon:yes gene_type:complete